MTSNHPNTLATLHFEANPHGWHRGPEEEPTLGTVLHQVKLHSPRFFALVKKANLANYYNDSATSCTLFIPSLDDFRSRDTEVEVCKMHTVNGKLRLDWLLMNPNVRIPTLSTQTLEVTTGTGPGLYINDAEIKYGDIECTNGIIHVLI